MSSKKFYAVRKGRVPGIYQNWEECKGQIDGFSGAEYKSFATSAAAIEYLNPEDRENKFKHEQAGKSITVYVDGSYSPDRRLFSYACVFLDGKGTTLSGVSSDIDVISMRNVAGELFGAMEAIKWAVDNRFSEIIICFDYEGIEKWANNSWKANKTGTKRYVDFIKKYERQIKITFQKVKAHSGNEFNEIADQLAKESILNYEESPNTEKKKLVEQNLELFRKCMFGKDKNTKNSFLVKFEDFEISENKLKKLAKALWVSENKNIKSIDSIHTVIDYNMRTFFCEIKDKNGEFSNFSIEF
ncbi:Ribonuclease H [compost metagenome]